MYTIENAGLNYSDIRPLYGYYSTYNLMSLYDLQKLFFDALDNTGAPKRNRAEARKHIREVHRRNVISIRIKVLLEGVPMDERLSFTREELIELHRIQQNEAGYDYWPISKSVTRKLRGLVKKQKGRRIIVSLEDFLGVMPYTLNEEEI